MDLPIFLGAGAGAALEAERLLHANPSRLSNFEMVVILMLIASILAWSFKPRR